MVLLAVISTVFAGLAAWRQRWWALLVPFVVYLGLAWLEQLGILPGYTSLGGAMIAGLIGTGFAALGLMLGRAVRRRSTV